LLGLHHVERLAERCAGWRAFRSPDFEINKNALTNPVVIDGRNVYDPQHMHDLGFTYYSIGRGV
jgi:UDPglucose 6-dehydrogenase